MHINKKRKLTGITTKEVCKFTIKTASYEPPLDKTNKVSVGPAKTQISLGIHPV